jgi:hypothetical protein
VRFHGPHGDLLLFVPLPAGFAHTVKDGWCSPRFGVRDRSFRFEASGSAPLPLELCWAFAAVPKGDEIAVWVERLTVGQTLLSETPS